MNFDQIDFGAIKNICYCDNEKFYEAGRVVKLTWSFPNMGLVDVIIFMDDENNRMITFTETDFRDSDGPSASIWGDGHMNLYVGKYHISIYMDQDLDNHFRNVKVERMELLKGRPAGVSA